MTGSITGSVNLDGSITIGTGPVLIGAGYELLAAGVDTISRRRDVAVSPWVKGEAEIASVQAALSYGLSFNVVGTSFGDAMAKTAAALVVVQQKTWTLTVTLDGYTKSYACRAASSIEAALDRNYVINRRRTITMTIPVKEL